MKTYITILTIPVLAIGMMSASQAFALETSVSTDTNIKLGAPLLKSDLNTNTRLDSKINVEDNSISGGENLETKADIVNDEDDTPLTGVVDANNDGSENDRDLDSEIIITQSDADTIVSNSTLRISSANNVNNINDLEAYIGSEIKSDAKIKKVVIADNTVSVYYRVPSRFLGIFPTSISTNATVSTAGETKIDYPWYRFLFALDSDLDASFTGFSDVSMKGNLNSKTTAEIFDRMHSVLQASTQAELDASK